jgi:hypothetical protein
MTEQTLLADLSRQFPQLPTLDLTLLTRTLFPLSLVELYTLRLAHGDNAIMKAAIDSTIRQRQEEKEIAALERQHEIYDEYLRRLVNFIRWGHSPPDSHFVIIKMLILLF